MGGIVSYPSYYICPFLKVIRDLSRIEQFSKLFYKLVLDCTFVNAGSLH